MSARKQKKIPSLLLVIFATAALALAAALSTDVVESTVIDPDTAGTGGEEDDDDDDDGLPPYLIPHEGNSTVSATFSIRVTPEHYHMLSWTVLWLCFAAAVVLGMYQTRLERRWQKHVTAASMVSSRSSSKFGAGRRKPTPMGSDPELGAGGRKSYRSGGGRLVLSSGRSRSKMIQSASSSSIHNTLAGGTPSGDEVVVSSGDRARATFRRLLLTAMISRTIAIPIQVYSDPLWLQLIADTFPVMAFASAWTWLVCFFVQLVGVALGTIGTPSHGQTRSSQHPPAAPTTDTVIQITAYVVYAFLIVSFAVFRRIAAAVLLYALLCCVYATLLGTGLYYCPRLVGLLLPGLGEKWHRSPLALRLVFCSSVCLLVFAAHTLGFAEKVVHSTGGQRGSGPYWWFQYGALELLPGLLFLILLHPKKAAADGTATSPPGGGDEPSKQQQSYGGEYPVGRRTPPLHAYHRRTDSNDSKSGTTASGATIPRMVSPTQPSRTSPLPQQPYTGGSASSKETTPLLASQSGALRYGGGAATSGGLGESSASIDAGFQQQLQQHAGGDRSATPS
eukprot:CAMPEP_0197178030 /NCGR_PEP_ID=MMETSP1423-20130617/3419_1 /TAXON_ID=476441 /ORGANISM="Pseudo-nitzschia heimii, Strain UNC1101" /LENGTH=562 /DNA_ID=CAMNT_0042627675 /DNA_START=164 /DNA_END=1852 /DNA_ORIENTATION=+